MDLNPWIEKTKRAAKKVNTTDPKFTLAIGLGTMIAFLWVTHRRSSTAPGLERSEKYITTLHPKLQPKARAFINDAHRAGIDIVVTSGRRSMASQQALYNQGRTAPGNIVTNAKPGYSWHNHGLAFDVAILKNGQPTWPDDSAGKAKWKKLGEIGRKHELEHGASFGDNPHFDYHPGITIAQAASGKQLVV